MGWVQFFLAESQSRLYPHMHAKFGSDPTAGSKILSFKFIIGFVFRQCCGSGKFVNKANIGRELGSVYLQLDEA